MARYLTQELCSVWAIELDGCACCLLVTLQIVTGEKLKGPARGDQLTGKQ